MARSKPNKPLKSPNKTKQNKTSQNKTKQNKTQSETPLTMKATTKPTETESTNESTENRDRPQEKYERNPANTPYYEGDKIYRRIKRKIEKSNSSMQTARLLNRATKDSSNHRMKTNKATF
jgi:hypothetical protein